MNSQCHFCGNKHFKNTQVQYIYQLNNQFLIMDGVPCEQCEFCGEHYFEGKVLRQIEDEFNRIYVQGKKPEKELRVPIERFTEVDYS